MIIRLPSVLGALVLALGTVGCTGGVPTPPAPLAGTQTPPTPSPSPRAVNAGQQLAERARLGIVTDYAARYTLTGTGASGVLTVSHLAGGVRVEIEDGASLATLLSTPAGTVACTGRAPQATCLTVAAAGQAVPSEFDAGVQRVFLEDLTQLATTPTAYDVVDAVAPSPSPGSAAMSCWQVSARSGAPQPVAPSGVYCFGLDGVPTAITYARSSLALSERLPAPTVDSLLPPATPRPLS